MRTPDCLLCFVISLLLASSPPIGARAAGLTADAGFYANIPDISPDVQSIEKIISLSTNDAMVTKRQSGTEPLSLVVDLDFKYGLSRTVAFAVNKLPRGYSWRQFKVDLPFYLNDKTLEVTLFATNALPGDRQEVKWLSDNDPTNLNGPDLFLYHARAFVQAKDALDKARVDAPVTRDQIRSVYAYLLNGHELAMKAYVDEGRELLSAGAWLKIAIGRSVNAVGNTVGLDHANRVIEQVNRLNRDRYSRMWDSILNYRNGDYFGYCRYVHEFQKRLRSLSDEEQLPLRKIKLTAIVGDAFAQCLVDYGRSRKSAFVFWMRKEAWSSKARQRPLSWWI
jgi:hypothetical protein